VPVSKGDGLHGRRVVEHDRFLEERRRRTRSEPLEREAYGVASVVRRVTRACPMGLVELVFDIEEVLRCSEVEQREPLSASRLKLRGRRSAKSYQFMSAWAVHRPRESATARWGERHVFDLRRGS